MPLDYTQAVSVGGAFADRERISEPVTRYCDGCGALIVFTASADTYAKHEAIRQGKRLYHCCQKCAGPWIDQVLRGNGCMRGNMPDGPEIARNMLQERRLENLERN